MFAPVLLLVAACSGDDPTLAPANTPTPTPEGPGPSRVVPTPTPADDPLEAERVRTVAIVERFGEEFTEVTTPWGAFDAAFDEYRHGLAGCAPSDRAADLAGWVIDFRPIVTAVTAIEMPTGTTEVRAALASVVLTEESGLRSLRDTWSPGNGDAFSTYEAARTGASILRHAARSQILDLIATAAAKAKDDAEAEAAADAGEGTEPTATPEPPLLPPPGGFGPVAPPQDEEPLATVEELKELLSDVESVDVQWQRFHDRYDAWDLSGGACSQEDVRVRLGELSSGFQVVLDGANAVQRPSVVRPLAEQLINAAVIESLALDALRTGWAPYDEAPWDRFLAARSQADLLCRQVRSSLDELDLEYGSGG